MPSKLVNNTLSSLSAGVTQQFDQVRYDSQVTKMINCIPSLTRGVLRRNPVTFQMNLQGLPSDISKSFVYTYSRGTVNDQYMFVLPGNGYSYVYDVTDLTGTPLYTSPYNAYLVVPTGTAHYNFRALTVGDFTFILNGTVTTDFLKGNENKTEWEGLHDMAFYWIKKTTSIVKAQEQTGANTATVTSGSLMEGYDYTINDYTIRGTEDTRPTKTAVNLNTGSKIAEAITNNSATSKLDEFKDSIAYNKAYSDILNAGGETLEWEDSFASEASLGVYNVVEDSDLLPSMLPPDLHNFKVRVSSGTSAETDDYWLQYSNEDKGWKETTNAGVFFKLDPTTMPHIMYNKGSNGFEFNTFQGIDSSGNPDGVSAWGEKTVGSDDILDTPSFIGRPLKDILFYKNRLGFITGDSIILSQTSVYGNFFVQTKQEILDDDPIDLSVASTNVTVLRRAVPTAGQLILFADDTQFSLESTSGPLTPTSADITALSNYTYNQFAPAQSIGNRVYFSNIAGGYSQIHSYRVTDQGSKITEADPMTIHLPTYIDYTINKIIGHDVLGYVFMTEEGYPNSITVLNTVIKEGEALQNAFHRWTFSKEIVSTHIIDNDLYILFQGGILTKIILEVPGDSNLVSYYDTYSAVEEAYESGITFSKFFLRDDKGMGTERGRYQLRTIKHTVSEDSEYITNIYNKNHSLFDEDTMYGPTWEDTDTWADDKIWLDIDPLYSREYVTDDKVTVMANNDNVVVTFMNNKYKPDKGFELATANIEASFTQRSLRT